MPRSDSLWQRDPVFRHTVRWYLLGILWWILLVFAFEGAAVVTLEDGKFAERSITFASRAKWAPVMAIPFGIVGLVIGLLVDALGSKLRTYWVPVVSGVGAVACGAWILASSPFDGWLALTMPLACVAGGVFGAFLCVVVKEVWDYCCGRGE